MSVRRVSTAPGKSIVVKTPWSSRKPSAPDPSGLRVVGARDIDGGEGEGGRRANHRSPRGRRTCQQSDGNRAQKEQSYESSMGLSPKRCHEISSSLNGSRWVLEVT